MQKNAIKKLVFAESCAQLRHQEDFLSKCFKPKPHLLLTKRGAFL
jgi:hypothetical protein